MKIPFGLCHLAVIERLPAYTVTIIIIQVPLYDYNTSDDKLTGIFFELASNVETNY